MLHCTINILNLSKLASIFCSWHFNVDQPFVALCSRAVWSLCECWHSLVTGSWLVVLLSGGPGLLDPCEKETVDAVASLSLQQREDITRSAQVLFFVLLLLAKTEFWLLFLDLWLTFIDLRRVHSIRTELNSSLWTDVNDQWAHCITGSTCCRPVQSSVVNKVTFTGLISHDLRDLRFGASYVLFLTKSILSHWPCCMCILFKETFQNIERH